MNSKGVLRVLAFALDWLVLAVWGGLLFGMVMLSSGGAPPKIGNPWLGQVLSFLVMTLPFTLYFAFSESSVRRASLGKRVCRLEVVGGTGERLGFATCFLRNALKFVPWELGHMAAHHAVHVDPSSSRWLWVPLGLSVIGCFWWVGSLLFSGETPYDRWVGARVAPSIRGQ